MSKTGRIVVAVAVVVVILGAGLWWFVLRDTAPPSASIDAIAVPTTTGSSGTDDPGSSGSSAGVDGTWKVVVGDDVFVGYRVDEQFGGETITKTAAGRTPAVTGSVVIDGDSITQATFTADVTQLKSDQAQRDGAIKSRGLQTEQFPQATFTLTQPIELSSEPTEGQEVTVSATGDLTLHGVTKPITVDLTAKWSGSAITVAGSAPITMADYGMDSIEIPGFVKTADHGTLELQLVLQPA